MEENICKKCEHILTDTVVFCPHCGQKQIVSEEISENIFTERNIIGITVYYLITIILLGFYKLTDIFNEDFSTFAIISGIDAFLTLLFVVYYSRETVKLYSNKISWMPFLYIIPGTILTAIIVNYTADFINMGLFDRMYSFMPIFKDTQYPVLYAFLFISIMPAIFEEMAFRGFIFSTLESVFKKDAAIYVSSFLFGITHFASISLFWLIPLGLVWGYLRARYNTLWYGMISHALFNGTIVVIELLS